MKEFINKLNRSLDIDRTPSYPSTVKEEDTKHKVKVIKCGNEKEFEAQVSNFLHQITEMDFRVVSISHSSHYSAAFGDRYIALIVFKD
jgi:hypothetical protein